MYLPIPYSTIISPLLHYNHSMCDKIQSLNILSFFFLFFFLLPSPICLSSRDPTIKPITTAHCSCRSPEVFMNAQQ
eukprot:UN08645